MDLIRLNPSERQDALAIIRRCAVDRRFFVEHVLGVQDVFVDPSGNEHRIPRGGETLDGWELKRKGIEDWQWAALEDLDNGETKISVRSAVGVGKTALVSWLALHFLLFRDDVKIIVTSPSFNQLSDGLIPEVQKWAARLPDWMREQLSFTSERVTRKPETATNFISFRTARKETPEALQGIHATHVMLLVDEASGVHETVYEAGQGTLSTKGAIAVLISNPTRVTGLFYRTHRKLRGLWKTYKVTSFQSTRVDPAFPEQMALTYGKDSQQYKVRVLAEFPEGNADSVIPRLWVEEAIGRDISPPEGKRVWGIDPGRGGDATGFCSVLGNRYVEELRELNYENLMQVVGWAKRKWDDIYPKEAKPETIYVDVIGMGSGVADRLAEMGLPVVAINVAELAAVKDRFTRLRAELWYEAREFFEKKNCAISGDIPAELLDKFVEELSEPRFKEHSSGRIDVESKKDMRSRGLASPNLADALCLTMSHEGAVMNGLVGGVEWNKPLGYKAVGVV